MQNRILDVTESLPWLVFVEDEKLIGFAYAGSWGSRSAYRFTVESTVYVTPNLGSRGIGTQLYNDLLSELRKRSRHSVIAVISLPNPASIEFHEKFGFQRVGSFQEIGRKFDQWIDVGYWQLVL
jgi:phosphinothricin acetyltransferase